MVKERAKGARPGVRARVDRGTAIVVEEMRAQFRVFGEALEGMRDHFSTQFHAIDNRFDAMENRFDAMDTRFDGVDREIGLLKSAVLENTREIRHGLQRLDEKKVDRDEIEAVVERALGRNVPG